MKIKDIYVTETIKTVSQFIKRNSLIKK